MERCPMCPSRELPAEQQKRPVAGDFPETGGVLFVGEGPGREENNRGRVFIGRAGEEFNVTYLPRAGMSRSRINITNSCKCHWADSSDAPPDWLVASCAGVHLRRDIEECQPSLIVLMGGVACSLMKWDVEKEHGIYHPKETLLGWTGPIYVTHHPALGMHKTDKMQNLLDDFRDLKFYMRGQMHPVESMCPKPQYERLYHASQVRSLCDGKYLEPMGVDTESVKRWRGFKSTIKYTPDRLTFCHTPPHSYMIMRKDEGAIGEFAKQVRKFRKFYFQNFPHDDWTLNEMGVHVPMDRVFDTMSAAYHDGRLSKGLKAMGRRIAGIHMTSFDEIVVPYGYEMALEYLSVANTLLLAKPTQERTGEMVERNCPECKGKGVLSVGRGKLRKVYDCDCGSGKVTVPAMTRNQSLNQALARVFTDLRKGEVKVWERWERWSESDHLIPALVELIKRKGPLPLPSIDYVPEYPAMVYACGDALVTRLIGPELEKRVSLIRRMVRSKAA